ncbi:MAG: putative ABC transporter permease [Faecalibacterium sp.]|uniref:putative ABC transporter permease n=1 Tax=Faecalibacterium sp. TaxID=1971605 RepID=UPI003A483232
MNLNFYTLSVIYLVYSFLGWVGETVVATIKGRQFTNRGMASGPFCFVYGTAGVLLAVGLADLRTNWLALFAGSFLIATVVEWVTAKFLERVHHRRWWDYSGKKFNLDGYVCLQYSVLWGVLGAVSVRWGNDLLLRLCAVFPPLLFHIAVWVSMSIAALDQISAAVVVERYAAKHPRLEQLGQELGKGKSRLQQKIAASVERRIQKAYPEAARPEPTTTAEKAMSFSDLVWLFVVGAFLGDVVETIFCRVTAGVWMSRSSLVWGPFSVVWGLALVLAAVLLRGSERKSESRIFWFGVILGGAYEYVCSAVTELLFGTVFWDYSGFKFNLGGRINLLYCFFWGIAAVAWIRYGYPLVAKGMNKLKTHIRPWMTAALAVFMAVNMGVSTLALARYDARTSGVEAATPLAVFLDAHFDNARMERIYPNAKKVEKAE